jgi:thiol-disulfide isomerase/thioredoxin
VAAFVPLGAGCSETITPLTTSVSPTTPEVLEPKALDEAAPKAVETKSQATKTTGTAVSSEVTLVPLKFDAFRARLAANKEKAKLFLVDAWATNCAPCKENFPHLVEMHHKFAPRGLQVLSVSFDDPTEAKDVADAKQFLKEKKAVFTNVLLDEDAGQAYEKFGVNAIPAVFLYGPDGKEVKRFTMDDPDNQFTYAEVEETVAAMLDGKPVPPPRSKRGSEKPKEETGKTSK